MRQTALVLAWACVALHANAAPADVGTRCDFGAFVNESDPAGLNVRSAPAASAKVLGRLPPSYANPAMNGYRVKVEVDVLGSRNGWFLITNAQDNEALTEKAARSMYHGRGWVYGRKLTVKSQARKGRAQPDPRSEVVFSTASVDSFDNDEMVDAGALLACSGKWALVELDRSKLSGTDEELKIAPSARSGLSRGRFRTWLNQICNIQETSCSGLGGEDEELPPR